MVIKQFKTLKHNTNYTVYIQKFKSRDAANIDFKELKQILSKYEKVESDNFYKFIR